MEELNCKVVFTIPVGKGLPIYESVVVTWIVMAILVLLSIILVRNLKVENPGKKQLALEAGYLFFRNFFHNLLGERGARYIPYMTMIVLFIGLSDIMGVFGFVPPTKGYRCDDRTGDYEHYPDRVFRDSPERDKGVAEKLCRAYSHYASHQYTGAWNPTAVFVYAVVRECTGILCGNEADRNYLSDFASDTI